MDPKDVRKIIKYLKTNCCKHHEYEQLKELQRRKVDKPWLLRKLYRISILIHVYPECPFCHMPINNLEELSIDHIIPKSRGGAKNDLVNLQPMHVRCNSKKGNIIPVVDTDEATVVTKTPNKCHHRRLYRTEKISAHTVEELERMCAHADAPRNQVYAKARHKHR